MANSDTDNSAGDGQEERALRCLRITDFTFWSGSTSLAALSASFAGLPTVTVPETALVERDIDLLARQGLPIRIDANRWCQIYQVVPGFTLRLSKEEASAIWAWCVVRNGTAGSAKCEAPDKTIADAVVVLQEGLKIFHPGSEMMADGVTTWIESGRLDSEQPSRITLMSELLGEARLVYRRLRIVDLIDSRTALNISQLAAVLDVCQRTVHSDLTALRHVGIEITYGRDGSRYVRTGLNRYLAEHLNVWQAAALLVFFEAPEDAPDTPNRSPALRCAARKLVLSIRLGFAGQEQDLHALRRDYQSPT